MTDLFNSKGNKSQGSNRSRENYQAQQDQTFSTRSSQHHWQTNKRPPSAPQSEEDPLMSRRTYRAIQDTHQKSSRGNYRLNDSVSSRLSANKGLNTERVDKDPVKPKTGTSQFLSKSYQKMKSSISDFERSQDGKENPYQKIHPLPSETTEKLKPLPPVNETSLIQETDKLHEKTEALSSHNKLKPLPPLAQTKAMENEKAPHKTSKSEDLPPEPGPLGTAEMKEVPPIKEDIQTVSTSSLAAEGQISRRAKKNKVGKKMSQEEAKEATPKGKKKLSPYSLQGYSIFDKLGLFFDILMNLIRRFFIFAVLFMILMGGLGLGAGMGYFAALVGKTPAPSKDEMTQAIHKFEQQSTLYYASGQPIANVRTDVVRSMVSKEEISPNIINGLVAIEDENFYEHNGVSPKATLRAVLQTLLVGSGTGGSTLTQQLVKQQLLSNEVTFFRKANEILLALRLENYFTKDDIITAYLNVSPFGRNNKGENIAGIRAAAEGIFGKEPSEVNLPQAAFLVGLPQAPYNYTPYDQSGERNADQEAGITRMKNVLFKMYRNQYIDKSTYEEALNYDVTKDFLPQATKTEERQSYLYNAIVHGAVEKLMEINIQKDGQKLEQVYANDEWYNDYYFAAKEQLKTGGYKVYSTIDKEIYDQLQKSAQAYNDQIGVSYEGVYTDPNTGEETYYVENVQTGMVVIDNPTGRVLGFIAGTDFENNQIDHAFQMHRSPGSTIKPLAVYGPAIEHDLINPSTVIPDTDFVVTYNDGTEWRPTNYGQVVSNSFITARKALYKSDNIPAVRVYKGLQDKNVPVIDYLKLMGFNTVDSYTEEDTKNLAFALGGVTTGPTVFEETSAFTTFANGGYYIDGYYIDRIEDASGKVIFQQNTEPVKVFSEDTNYLMVNMLQDTNKLGTGRFAAQQMTMGGDWIAKSGISENSKDLWYIASTPKITIGSWIGYDSKYQVYNIDINDGFGGESLRSQTYWSHIVNDLYQLRPDIFGVDEKFTMPNSVEKTAIVETTGTLPGAIQTDMGYASIGGPLVEGFFKKSNPAPELTFDFMFGASQEEIYRFWSEFLYHLQEEKEAQQDDSHSQAGNRRDETADESHDPNATTSETTVDPLHPTTPSQPDPMDPATVPADTMDTIYGQ